LFNPLKQRILVEHLRKVADAIAGSVAQVAIAWVAGQDPDIVPLVGARRRDRLNEALGALDLTLTAANLASLAEAVPAGAVAGERYPVAQLADLDSGSKYARQMVTMIAYLQPNWYVVP
jgi:diketogulonate reductase-like aldo/keto reductase